MEIFLVEDNPGDILLIDTLLHDHINVRTSFVVRTNGFDASLYVKRPERIPDLIILDVNLPHKNGFEIFAEIKSNERFNDVPVVFFTSSNNQLDKLKALSMGAKDYVIKSIDLEEYRRQVLSFLNFVHN